MQKVVTVGGGHERQQLVLSEVVSSLIRSDPPTHSTALQLHAG